MQKQTLCFLVLGASLGVLLQNLAKRRQQTPLRRIQRAIPAEVIDLKAWRESRGQLALSTK